MQKKKNKGVSQKQNAHKKYGSMEQKNDKQHLENVWRKQAKFMDNPAKSYGGFSEK